MANSSRGCNMITFDFEFYQPSTIEDALDLFQQFHSEGKNVMYYSGGTEFISRARRNEILADVVIDVKRIPECYVLDNESDNIIIGSAVSLNKITEEKVFPLLGDVCKEIATRTERNKITIGGNIASNLPYKECILECLVADSDVVIAGRDGILRKSIHDVIGSDLAIEQGEFIVQIITKKESLKYPYFHFRRTAQSKVNYPILSMACLLQEGKIKVAFSGLCSFPFRSEKVENVLNDVDMPLKERFNKVIHLIPYGIVEDFFASKAYRLFVLEKALEEMIDGAGVVS